MSEAIFQAKTIRKYEKRGWFCIRLIQTNKNGISDYLLMKKGEEPFFIEFKAKGEEAKPLQVYRHKEIEQKTGCKTIVMIEP